MAAKDAEGNSGGHGRPGERINYGGRCNDAGRYGDVHTFMVSAGRLPAWRSQLFYGACLFYGASCSRAVC